MHKLLRFTKTKNMLNLKVRKNCPRKLPNHPPIRKITIRAKSRGSKYFKENA